MGLLTGKTALITGASKGIGRSIAEAFAREGAKIIATGRDENELNRLMLDLVQNDFDHSYYVMDITKYENVKRVFKELKQKKIGLDILVNNAGIMRDGMMNLFSEEIYHANFDTNVKGTIFTTKEALNLLIRKRNGCIINIGSIIGVKGNKGQAVYSASKSALIGLTSSISKELAPLGVRVNCIAPGFINTNLTSSYSEDMVRGIVDNIGMRRLGEPEDVADVAVFLASDLARYVTNQVIGVDGGMII